MDGKEQPATSQISEMDTPLDHVQEEAMPLMEWALTPIGQEVPPILAGYGGLHSHRLAHRRCAIGLFL